MRKKIKLTHLRDLKSKPDKDGASFGLSAASGLVKIDNTIYVVADDELALGVFSLLENGFDYLCELLPGELPVEPKARKKIKPDWESLVHIAGDELTKAALLAVPSGSTDRRQQGIYFEVNSISPDTNNLKKLKVDFSLLYTELSKSFKELNIEGSCILEKRLLLFQRGNGAEGKNAIIELDLTGVLKNIKNLQALAVENIDSIKEIALGALNGSRLGFTDACVLKNKIWFLAAAETGDSTYHDGSYTGAIIGRLNSSKEIAESFEIDCNAKPEGLSLEEINGEVNGLIVTDADDPAKLAGLYSFTIN